MKNKLLLTIVCIIIGTSYCEISAEEVIAQWSDFKNLVAFDTHPSSCNIHNNNFASLQRINDQTKIVITANNDGFPRTDLWHKEDDMEKYWIATFSTKGCSNIKVTTSQYSSEYGPRDFKIQYRTENREWTDLNVSIKVEPQNKWTSSRSILLPSSLENQPKVSMRWLVSSETAANSKYTIRSSGANRINLSISAVYQEPTQTTWQPQSTPADWSDANNWSNGVPDTFSNIEIRSGSNFYPTLKAGDQAICDTIFFKTDNYDISGEILNSHLLQYNTAVVELLPSPNQYHLISPPLSGIYSGDFFVKASFDPLVEEGNKRNTPGIWMKLYQTTNPEKQTRAQDSDWSGYFNSLDYLIAPGSGICIWIDDDNVPAGHKFAEHMVVAFPKDSSRYSYFDKNGAVTKTTGELMREKPGRFAYESLEDYDSESGSFSIPVTSDFSDDKVFGSAIVGNPFMCHLDFSKFQQANSNKIEAVYKIWGGNTFEEGILYGEGEYSLEKENYNYIAPMQAFVVTKKDAYKGQRLGSLYFSPDMGELKPGVGLRSASLTKEIKTDTRRLSEEKINIVVINAGEIEIQSPEDDPVKAIFCYNLQGQVIVSKRGSVDNKHTIDTSALPKFVIVKVITERNIEIRKLSF